LSSERFKHPRSTARPTADRRAVSEYRATHRRRRRRTSFIRPLGRLANNLHVSLDGSGLS